jgi:hypothetical protein
MTLRELFEFVTDPSITSSNINLYLEKVGGDVSFDVKFAYLHN